MQLISKNNFERISYFVIGVSIMLLMIGITLILDGGIFLEN
jgi:hypothetical protein